MRILAIDPGYERVGVAILEKDASLNRGKETLLYSDCFKTSAKIPFYERLNLIANEITAVIETHSPKALAIETLFFSKNQKTAMQVSEARGVIIQQASHKGLAIFEYDPVEIKVAITGYGKSDKHQITAMVPKLVQINKKIAHDDEFDAIAIGITCFATDFAKLRSL